MAKNEMAKLYDFSLGEVSQQCFLSYPEEWIIKARETAWLVLTVVPLLIMIGLYYRVVHLLWFKNCGGDSQFSSKQKVRPGLLNVLKGTVVQRRWEGVGVGYYKIIRFYRLN